MLKVAQLADGGTMSGTHVCPTLSSLDLYVTHLRGARRWLRLGREDHMAFLLISREGSSLVFLRLRSGPQVAQ